MRDEPTAALRELAGLGYEVTSICPSEGETAVSFEDLGVTAWTWPRATPGVPGKIRTRGAPRNRAHLAEAALRRLGVP